MHGFFCQQPKNKLEMMTNASWERIAAKHGLYGGQWATSHVFASMTIFLCLTFWLIMYIFEIILAKKKKKAQFLFWVLFHLIYQSIWLHITSIIVLFRSIHSLISTQSLFSSWEDHINDTFNYYASCCITFCLIGLV